MSELDALDHARAFQLAAEEAERIGRQSSSDEVAKLHAGAFYTIAAGYLALSREIRDRPAEKSDA